MKLIDIALKDLRQSFRNAMFLVFGLVLPLLTGALFFFAFGGQSADEGGFDLPPIQVQIADQDQGQTGFSAGQVLADALQTAIPDLVQTTSVSNAFDARTAVDRQQAAVAVIVPEDFTASIFDPDGHAAVEIYQDPTLTLGPDIVRGLVGQVVDSFAGSKIATLTAADQLAAHGSVADPATLQSIGTEYAAWAASAAGTAAGEPGGLLALQAPSGNSEEGGNQMAQILGLIMTGMMVFYVFFTGAAGAQSILREEETGTLPRIFTTPTPQSTVLGGKMASVFLLLAVQVTMLIIVSRLVFGVRWGAPLPVAVAILALVILASSFGVFVNSWLKDTRQAGIVFGGVMTVLGMIGMLPVFAGGVPGNTGALDRASLVTPHGWGVQVWRQLLAGGGLADILVTVAVMVGAGAIFFIIGVIKFNRRYA
jgi:ABC-2 type transport system permease protein